MSPTQSPTLTRIRNLEVGSTLKDLMKFASLMKQWPWARLGYLLAVGLLVKHIVTFEQAVLLMLLSWVGDWIGSDRKKKSVSK